MVDEKTRSKIANPTMAPRLGAMYFVPSEMMSLALGTTLGNIEKRTAYRPIARAFVSREVVTNAANSANGDAAE
jgi:hypothetical protein